MRRDATGKTSQDITPIHFFEYFNFFGSYHYIQLHKYKWTNKNTQTQKYKYTNTNTYNCLTAGNLDGSPTSDPELEKYTKTYKYTNKNT